MPHGSSPLARGLRGNVVSQGDGLGIIPARAGFTSRLSGMESRVPDHPRSRGVYGRPSMYGAISGGSSPLARGLPCPHAGTTLAPGIIPARAGFTLSQVWPPPTASDHPRSRGVYFFINESIDGMVGSSPLARGLRGGEGVTQRHRVDHPRSRGVYPLAGLAATNGIGSSPLARGLLHHPVNVLSEGGIIPARAGFTCVTALRVSA